MKRLVLTMAVLVCSVITADAALKKVMLEESTSNG